MRPAQAQLDALLATSSWLVLPPEAVRQEWLQDDEGVPAEEPGFCGGLIVALGTNGACHATFSD